MDDAPGLFRFRHDGVLRHRRARAEQCAVCGEEITSETVYLYTDKVANEKTHVCESCSRLADECFVCGMPVKKDIVKLSDGRVLSARDAFTVGELGKVRVAKTNILIRCLQIREDSARIQIIDSGEQRELWLKKPKPCGGGHCLMRAGHPTNNH